MKYLCKQIYRELLRNKIFTILLLLLTTFTSFMYYFVHFSVDANIKVLESIPQLTKNQQLFYTGLSSNIILSRNLLAAFLLLTAFVFAIYFLNFYRQNQKQLGGLKALGFSNTQILIPCLLYTVLLSLTGAVFGLAAGYFASDILILASEQSYSLTDLAKGLEPDTLAVGFFLPALVFGCVPYLTFLPISRREAGLLLNGTNQPAKDSVILRISDRTSRLFPEKIRLPIRLALRRPVAVFLILLSTAGFTVMFLLSYSLYVSSPTVYRQQTAGRSYLYDNHYNRPQLGPVKNNPDAEGKPYLDTGGSIRRENTVLPQTLISLHPGGTLFLLLDSSGNPIPLPEPGEIVIPPSLQELYGFKVGEQVTITWDTTQSDTGLRATITAVAFNAESNHIYLSQSDLSQIMGLPDTAYNGIYSIQNRYDPDTLKTSSQIRADLERDSVSNRTSAVINQVIGCLIGCILLYLALLLNFQSSTREILILHMMGYTSREVRKMLIDIYRPILIGSFLLLVYPAVLTVKTILRSLSLQTGDYMPFQTSPPAAAAAFLILAVLYFLVQLTFTRSLRSLLKMETVPAL
ncbi:ABC transporter permease [Diplocloster hominis]|uniref:ABC transporter permease n=1 Tax=Diplocloster hominis TaxID=3079010 RepID=UPI0031BBB2CC